MSGSCRTVPDRGIFRQYDIRGVVGESLNPQVARAVGRAYGSELRVRLPGQTPRVVVGKDNRLSSPALADAVVEGVCASGCDVMRLGVVPTPVAYFAEYELKADGAVQVTGSHNPPEYNGIKMTMAKASIYGDAIQDLWRRIDEGDLIQGGLAHGGLAEVGGSAETVRLLPEYVSNVKRRFDLARPVKVVADCGNGTASVVAVELMEAIGAEVVPLYCESDGTFPNHHPDPTVDKNVRDLAAAVRRHGAELGIGFDGDGDRIGAVNGDGQIVRSDLLLLLFGLDLLERRGPGAKMVFDVKCSQVLPQEFAKAGGVPVMWKTGHSLVKQKMRETGAPIAGELSGHICFADDFYGFDDALYAACRLLELLARSQRSLAEMVASFPSYASTPEIRIDVPDSEKFDVVQRATEHFARHYEVNSLDGVRILFEDGWGLVRASNTQPVVVARYEASSETRLRAIRDEVEGWLRTQGIDV